MDLSFPRQAPTERLSDPGLETPQSFLVGGCCSTDADGHRASPPTASCALEVGRWVSLAALTSPDCFPVIVFLPSVLGL